MVEMLDASGSSLIFRNSAGVELLNTADRMPARIGDVTFSNITLSFPPISGEGIFGRGTMSGIEYRYILPAHNVTYTVDLGNGPGTIIPNFAICTFNGAVTSSAQPYGYWSHSQKFKQSVWQPFQGSIHLESCGTSNVGEWELVQRHCYLTRLSNGHFGIVCRQTSAGYTGDWSTSPYDGLSIAAAFKFSFRVMWGIYDL